MSLMTDGLLGRFADEFTRSAKELLETKHLYQHVDLSDVLTKYRAPRMAQDVAKEVDDVIAGVSLRWSWADRHASGAGLSRSASSSTTIEGIWIRLPDARLFCRTCEDREPFNFVSAWNLMWEVPPKCDPTVQTFGATYECQSCKGAGEVLLVRREGLRLTLCGRSPMEHLEVPEVIPKPLRRHYSGARLAFHCNQVLQASFSLRVLVEQHARCVVGVPDGQRRERVVDEYMATLEADFKDRYPSLGAVYETLSDDIHGAVGDPEVFLRAERDIVGHFDALALIARYPKRVPPVS